MFRNGFNATRRSLLPIAHPRSLSTHKELTSSNFTCISCRFRSTFSAPKPVKRGRGTKADTFLGAIKRLEAHVQHIEKNYTDRIRQQKALEELPSREFTEEDKDRAYAALMAPPTPASFLPVPLSPLGQLPKAILRRLGEGSKSLIQKRQEWSSMLAEVELNGGLANTTTSEVNKLVSLIELDQRAALSSKILEMMENYVVVPNTLTYDLMMLAHAAVGNPTEVRTLFKDMRERGLTPSVYSYAHLLKAHSQQSDVQAATDAIQEMHALGILPNLVVYTTLIQTCINRGQLETAWQIFNLIKLKSTSTAPDAETYTLMIHACAMNGEVERALDLYTDMTDRRGLEPTHETYHAIIHACALRKDYFAQAWKFATEMQRQGLTVNRLYLNTLVQACGRTGELTRARLLVRHMMQSGRTGRDVYPDEITFQNLLRAYATYKAPGDNKNRSVTGGGGGGGGGGRVISGVEEPGFIVTGTSRLEKREEGQKAEEKVPFLNKGVLLTHKDVILEARQVFNWIREERPEFISTQLLNAYLDACQNAGGQPGFRDIKKCYSRCFSSEPEMIDEESSTDAGKAPVEDEENINGEAAEDDESPKHPPPPPRSPQRPRPEHHEPPPQYLPPRNIHTFATALQAAYKDRDLTFARKVMADREKYQQTLSYQRMFPEEKRKHDFYVERIMIDILAAREYLGEAAGRLEKNLERFEWKQEHLKTLYVRAVQLEDLSTIRLCNRVAGREENRY